MLLLHAGRNRTCISRPPASVGAGPAGDGGPSAGRAGNRKAMSCRPIRGLSLRRARRLGTGSCEGRRKGLLCNNGPPSGPPPELRTAPNRKAAPRAPTTRPNCAPRRFGDSALVFVTSCHCAVTVTATSLPSAQERCAGYLISQGKLKRSCKSCTALCNHALACQ